MQTRTFVSLSSLVSLRTSSLHEGSPAWGVISLCCPLCFALDSSDAFQVEIVDYH
jgi:hypothetical protein